jgi:hypothetical protein
LKDIRSVPRIELDKLQEVESIFIKKVLKCGSALITDGSYLSDFIPLDDLSRAIGPGSKPNFFQFRVHMASVDPVTKVRTLTPKVWESEAVNLKPQFIRRAQQVFGVDIQTVFDEPIYKILLFITENYKSNKN